MGSEIAAFRLRNLDAKILKEAPFALALHTGTPSLSCHGVPSRPKSAR
jgi:hypothetical protein